MDYEALRGVRKIGLWKIGLQDFSENWAPTFRKIGLQRKFGLFVKKAEYWALKFWAPEEFWALRKKSQIMQYQRGTLLV